MPVRSGAPSAKATELPLLQRRSCEAVQARTQEADRPRAQCDATNRARRVKHIPHRVKHDSHAGQNVLRFLPCSLELCARRRFPAAHSTARIRLDRKLSGLNAFHNSPDAANKRLNLRITRLSWRFSFTNSQPPTRQRLQQSSPKERATVRAGLPINHQQPEGVGDEKPARSGG